MDAQNIKISFSHFIQKKKIVPREKIYFPQLKVLVK
jgi:hypothetical protein